MESQKYYYGFIAEQETGDMVEMTFLTEWLEGFARWLMMYADMAEVVTPDLVSEKVKRIVEGIKVGAGV